MSYKKGRDFEYEVKHIFESNGYEVLRTAGSHSPYDLILIKYTPENKRMVFLTFVQCKIKKLKNNE